MRTAVEGNRTVVGYRLRYDPLKWSGQRYTQLVGSLIDRRHHRQSRTGLVQVRQSLLLRYPGESGRNAQQAR
ncbi:MAG: hypothetical protein QOK30_3221 [Nocardioidaceae bacterium]|jgi:hypothetical protein|nr:hypothetical protein [Nocardioidaceae bacterium]